VVRVLTADRDQKNYEPENASIGKKSAHANHILTETVGKKFHEILIRIIENWAFGLVFQPPGLPHDLAVGEHTGITLHVWIPLDEETQLPIEH